MSFWTELKRRNVVRVALAYLAGAWLIVQVAETLLDSFETPAWILRIIIIASAIGFPISLVLAWFYELTPEGVRPDARTEPYSSVKFGGRSLDFLIIGVLLLAVAFLMVNDNNRDESISLSSSIAVLPFDNLTADPENNYVSDGLADEVLSLLARISTLRVVPRTSSFSFKGRNVDVATVAETLMVDNVLEGSVRVDGDRVRVTAALVQNDAVVWTESYDRRLSEILDVQAEIARSVASEILPILSPESSAKVTKRSTNNVDAFDYYLRGLEYLNRPAEESTLSIASDLFDQAITLDARFAEAWAARCATRLSQYEFSGGVESFFSDAEADCRRAWTLDNDLWSVHLALGRLYRINGQYEDATVELRSAIDQQPNAVEAVIELGYILVKQDRFEEAESMFKKAISMDGGNWDVYRAYGHFFYDSGRYDEAIDQYLRVVEFTPDSGIGYDNLGNAYWAIGEFEKAAEAFGTSLRIAPSRWAYSGLGSMQFYLGDFASSVENQLRAIDLAPEDHVAWGRLGEAYKFLPDAENEAHTALARATELVRRELQINPDNWDNIGLLSIYYALDGQPSEAHEQLEQMLQLAPAQPAAHYYAAIVHSVLGDVGDALDALEQSVGFGMSPVFILRDPRFAVLRESPRFQSLF